MGPELRKLVTAPLGAGGLDRPTHAAEGENPACGDKLRFEARCSERRIEDLAFRASACPACMAVASLAVRVYSGREQPAGPRLDVLREEVERLGGLSRFEQHALALVEEVLARCW